MWVLVWRLAVGTFALATTGLAALGMARYDGDPFWTSVINAGGWVFIGLLAVACIAMLITGFATAVLHVQPRGHGPAATDS